MRYSRCGGFTRHDVGEGGNRLRAQYVSAAIGVDADDAAALGLACLELRKGWHEEVYTLLQSL